MYRPTRGEIEIDGRPLSRLKRASWIRQIGFVFQDPVLLNQTVRENLAWSRDVADDDALWRVLEQVGMKEKVEALRLGLESPCGNRGELFSGGERQRLAIARALIGDPPILILDEPTSMVDELNRGRFRALIQAVARGRMLILASHDSSLGELADVTIGIANGRITSVSENPHDHGN
jgi:ABC-type multidrug transport system fused ATPase/permease subunit